MVVTVPYDFSNCRATVIKCRTDVAGVRDCSSISGAEIVTWSCTRGTGDIGVRIAKQPFPGGTYIYIYIYEIQWDFIIGSLHFFLPSPLTPSLTNDLISVLVADQSVRCLLGPETRVTFTLLFRRKQLISPIVFRTYYRISSWFSLTLSFSKKKIKKK